VGEQNKWVGWLDAPASDEVIDGTYLIVGWVLDRDEIKRVQIYLDDMIRFDAFYGDPRAAVLESYPSYHNPNCGFSFLFDTRKIENGRHNLKIVVTDGIDKQSVLTNIPIFIREHIEPFSASFRQFETLKKMYRKEVFDLSKIYRNLFTVIDDPEIVQTFIHHFEADPEGYDAKYYHLSSTEILLKNAVSEIQKWVALFKPKRILDIGCGGGDMTLAILDIFPEAQIISGDLSIGLLNILRDRIEKYKSDADPLIVQMNAEELDFQPQSLDLVIGKAILHHLFNPEKTIRGCFDSLKPGGCAVFFEPFENGNSLIALMMNVILEDARSSDLSPEIINFFGDWTKEINARKGRDKTLPMYREMDDKWLFTKNLFTYWAAQTGFSKCIITSLHKPQNMFQQQIKNLIQIGIEKKSISLPDWASEIVAKVDTNFSDDCKQDLLIEGAIILIK
jgi:ubiquinone/menaquinone biosynthesis C-methylase UbiE